MNVIQLSQHRLKKEIAELKRTGDLIINLISEQAKNNMDDLERHIAQGIFRKAGYPEIAKTFSQK